MEDNAASAQELSAFLSQGQSEGPGSPSIVGGSDVGAASDNELSEWLRLEKRREKYGSAAQQLVTGLEGAASAATFGLSTGVERALGVDPDDIRERREENPAAHGTGQVAGLVGSSFLVPGGGAVGVLNAAGQGAARAVGLGAAEGALMKMGSAAVRGAIENIVFQSGDEISKALLLDPNQSLETAVSNIGLSGIIGGGIGGAVGAVSPLWEATAGKRIRGLLTDVSNEANVAANSSANASTELLPEAAEAAQWMGALKPNAEEISTAAERLGVKPTAGTLSDAQFIGRLEDNLIKRPTIFGDKAAKETADIWNKLNKESALTLKGATTQSEAQVGREIKDGLEAELSKEFKPIAARYERLKPHLKAMDVTAELKSAAGQKLLANDLVMVAPNSRAAKLAGRISREIQGLKSVEDIKTYRTLINQRLRQAVQSGAEELPILSAAKNELTALREAAIENATINTGIGKQASKISSATIQDLREADSLYRGFKTKLQDVGREAGLGRVGDVRTLLEKFKNLPDEAFATKIFDAGDINQLQYFKANFPKQFEKARSYKLKEILEKSIDEGQGKNGKFSVAKYLRQLSDTRLNPETRDLLLGDSLQKYQDIKTIFQALPENFNPSGTASAITFGSMFSPQAIIDNAADALKYALLKGVPYIQAAAGVESSKATGLATMAALMSGKTPSSAGFKAAADYITRALKGETMINKAADAIIRADREVLPSKFLPDDKSLDRLDKKVEELNANMTPLFEAGGNVGDYMGAHAEAIGGLAGKAILYLGSIRPQNTPKNPLDDEIPVSKFQKENYRSALRIAESPLSVLERVKDGSIDSDDIQHLHALYPNLYQKLSQKLMEQVTDAKSRGMPIPYRTKLGLSMFLGQPLDSTMVPQSIQSIQLSQAPKTSQPQTPGTSSHSSLKDMGKLALSSETPEQARIRSKNQQ